MYQYPYGDSQQLNLDWIINKLIELEQSFVAGESAELEEFANALISLTYIPTQAYNNSDIVFHDGHLYRCNTTIPAPGEVWDPAHWDQIMLGNTVANLVRAVAGMNSDHVFNESNVPGTHVTEALNALVEDIRYDNHKIQQKKNGAYTDVIPVEDTPSNNSDRLASSKAAYDLKDAINTIKPTLNILAVGNSFDQDMFAYLPPVLNEMLPEYEINYCVLHQDSADFDLINTMYVDNTKFQYTNKWLFGENAWERIPSSGNSWTLKQAIQAFRWDMVFMQATTADVASDTTIQNKIITPGRKLTRAIIANAIAPLNFYTIEWLARGASDSVIDSTYTSIHNGMIKTMQNMGFSDYVPLGTAFQNARTNSTLKALGDGISMLYSDNIHVQAGAPALLGTYTIASFIAQKCGKPNGVYASAFQPTTANAEAINAKPSGSAVGMTHGNSTTITTVIKRALQEIVYITMNNPTVITDCSGVTATPPT